MAADKCYVLGEAAFDEKSATYRVSDPSSMVENWEVLTPNGRKAALVALMEVIINVSIFRYSYNVPITYVLETKQLNQKQLIRYLNLFCTLAYFITIAICKCQEVN